MFVSLCLQGTTCSLYLYLKPHRGSSSDLPVGRTLFISNFSPLSTSQLRSLFATFGSIEALHHTSDNQVHLVFNERSSLSAALSSSSTTFPPVTAPTTKNIGDWLSNYSTSFSSASALQTEINEFITSVETDTNAVADTTDDGFRPVTSGRKAPQDQPKKKKKREVGEGFYSFNKMTKRRSELADLRKAFEQDKQKIQMMRQSRRFRPC
ncbi:hypothetical protein P9112_004554 [Eukaryota sp. TZLM1-RC]